MKHFLIPNWLNDIYWSLFSDPDVAFGLLINLAVTWYPLVTGLVVGVGGKRSGPNMKRVEKNSCVIPNPWELISISCWFEKRSLPIWRFSQQQQSSHIKDSLFWTQGLCLPIFFLFFSLIFFLFVSGHQWRQKRLVHQGRLLSCRKRKFPWRILLDSPMCN